MMRPRHYWMIVAPCLLLMLAAVAWVSAMLLKLDRLRVEAQERALVEENVRLALWRMDTALMPLLARESARPVSAYSRPGLPGQGGESSNVVMHFQVDPDGRVISPEWPTGKGGKTVHESRRDEHGTTVAEGRLEELRPSLNLQRMLAMLPDVEPGTVERQEPLPATGAQVEVGRQMVAQQQGVKINVDQQISKNVNEYNWRNQQQAQLNVAVQRDDGTGREAANAGSGTGMMKPVWQDGRLLLVRRVAMGGREGIQGCWLNWQTIRANLLAAIPDLMEGADLLPAADAAVEDPEGRRLAGLPVVLVPGKVPGIAAVGPSPVWLSLGIAWCCLLVGVAAVAMLLAGAVSLGERRAAFVSAVTHELRTPLTTFRMYSEMLAGGMVTDDERRKEYLATLSAEADRLGHLVENVLAYARLERGRARGRVETVSVTGMLDRMSERLAQRATQAGMQVLVEKTGAETPRMVRTDVTAVEQILFNLVDNACKYAVGSTDKRIHIEPGYKPGEVVVVVRDHGPGISAEDARRLFMAFCKSAKHAAESAPGVGLGLALSRRLARELGGDLKLRSPFEGGACFELALPLLRTTDDSNQAT